MATPKKGLYIVAGEDAEALSDGEMTEAEALTRARAFVVSGNAQVFVYKALFRVEESKPPVKVTKL